MSARAYWYKQISQMNSWPGVAAAPHAAVDCVWCVCVGGVCVCGVFVWGVCVCVVCGVCGVWGVCGVCVGGYIVA